MGLKFFDSGDQGIWKASNLSLLESIFARHNHKAEQAKTIAKFKSLELKSPPGSIEGNGPTNDPVINHLVHGHNLAEVLAWPKAFASRKFLEVRDQVMSFSGRLYSFDRLMSIALSPMELPPMTHEDTVSKTNLDLIGLDKISFHVRNLLKNSMPVVEVRDSNAGYVGTYGPFDQNRTEVARDPHTGQLVSQTGTPYPGLNQTKQTAPISITLSDHIHPRQGEQIQFSEPKYTPFLNIASPSEPLQEAAIPAFGKEYVKEVMDFVAQRAAEQASSLGDLFKIKVAVPSPTDQNSELLVTLTEKTVSERLIEQLTKEVSKKLEKLLTAEQVGETMKDIDLVDLLTKEVSIRRADEIKRKKKVREEGNTLGNAMRLTMKNGPWG